MSTVQAWTRTGKGPWSPISAMSGDPRELAAMVNAASSVMTMDGGGQQIQLFTMGHNPNR